MNNNNDRAYLRFAPFIREYIYHKKWKTLRPFQEETAEILFNKKEHLLVAAGTAQGKTEAAFFPILSIMDALASAKETAPSALRLKPLVLYISPLKALINDQAQRLENFFYAGSCVTEPSIPIWRWHGDVDSNHKNRFIQESRGVLLITPESLEALLLRHPRDLGRIFSHLIFIVIDEVHVFMGTDRGSQLICQITRIEEAVKAFIRDQGSAFGDRGGLNSDHRSLNAAPYIRRVGLSATLGDYEGAKHWLSQGSNLGCLLAGDKDSGKNISLALDYHDLSPGINSGTNNSKEFYHSLYRQCQNKRVIIFTNSRLEAEDCAASLKEIARESGEPQVFHVHHGNVSSLLRNEAEEQLKTGLGPKAICATATLELGIDIGDLDRIIQLGPPWSVSAFVQRIGRSGRRSGKAQMYFSVTGNWELLRTMAVIQLYLKEKWIEPPQEKKLPFSLLVHQCLSLLASLGEHTPHDLASRLLTLPPFTNINAKDFYLLLSHLENTGCVSRAEEGTLILGLEGERIVHRHSFYSVFPGEETFRVMREGREIGTIHFAPDPLSVLVIGGKRWIVKSIDMIRREIWVEQTKDQGNERLWRGKGGTIHPRVAQTIRRILAENNSEYDNSNEEANANEYPYLSAAARKALNRERRAANELGICEKPLIILNKEQDTPESYDLTKILLFPWTGSAGIRTIAAVLKNDEHKKALKIVFMEERSGLYFYLESKLAAQEFRSCLIEACQKTLAFLNEQDNRDSYGEDILKIDIPYTDKFDCLLPPKLLAKQYAANMLDKEALETFIKYLSPL